MQQTTKFNNHVEYWKQYREKHNRHENVKNKQISISIEFSAKCVERHCEKKSNKCETDLQNERKYEKKNSNKSYFLNENENENDNDNDNDDDDMQNAK